MLYYNQNLKQDGMEPWPPLTDFGAKILSGDPQQRGRIDYGSFTTTMCVGVWEGDRGKFELTYPWSEQVTILEGSVTITDSSGKSVTYNPGDGHFARKGEKVTWDITTPKVKKAFFICWNDQEEKTAEAAE